LKENLELIFNRMEALAGANTPRP